MENGSDPKHRFPSPIGAVIGAVFDRADFVGFQKKRAVTDRAYRGGEKGLLNVKMSIAIALVHANSHPRPNFEPCYDRITLRRA